MTQWLIDKIVAWEPKSRRLWAVRLLIWSVVLMALNVGLYLTNIIDQADLILITLILSWLAISITCLDVIATTDVREESTQ